MTRKQYDARMDWLADESGMEGAELNVALEQFKASAVITEAARPRARPSAPPAPAPASAVTLTAEQFRALLPPAGAEAAPPPSPAAHPLLAMPMAELTPDELAVVSRAHFEVHAEAAGLKSPLWVTEDQPGPAQVAPAVHPLRPPPAARSLAPMDNDEFWRFCVAQVAGWQAAGHPSPFWKAGTG